jgi:hypothetical protein
MINNSHWKKISQNLWKIRRPARYIGKELNSVYKKNAGNH